jgi:hypothetical protein
MSVGMHLNDQECCRNTEEYILIINLTNVMPVGRHLNDQDSYRNIGGHILVLNLTYVMSVGRHLIIQGVSSDTSAEFIPENCNGRPVAPLTVKQGVIYRN